MLNSIEAWDTHNQSPNLDSPLSRFLFEWQIQNERKKAAILSERLADFVLHHGVMIPDSVWYHWNLVDPSGDTIKLEVSDVNKHDRNLASIMRGGNQNDRLEVYLRMPSIDFKASSTWSLPPKRLTWIRGYPSLNSTHPDWYTWFPGLLDDVKETRFKAYHGYVKFIQVISDAVFSPKPLQLK